MYLAWRTAGGTTRLANWATATPLIPPARSRSAPEVSWPGSPSPRSRPEAFTPAQRTIPARTTAGATFLLGPQARFFCGSVLFCDGGTDALLRPEDWPARWNLPTNDGRCRWFRVGPH